MFAIAVSLLWGAISPPVLAQTVDCTVEGACLPFPPEPSTSIANETIQDSTMKRRPEPDHLPKDAPNILVILLDDVGFGQAEAFGGEIHAPTIQRLWDEGIAYNTLEEMKQLFLQEAEENKVFPIGGGLWTRIYPGDRIASPYTSWTFDTTTTRMPEFTAPGLGRESNTVTIDVELNGNDSGVLYALGGASGGLTLFMEDGKLKYEYNMMLLERYKDESVTLDPGSYNITVTTTFPHPNPADSSDPPDGLVVVEVQDADPTITDPIATFSTEIGTMVPAAFTATGLTQ